MNQIRNNSAFQCGRREKREGKREREREREREPEATKPWLFVFANSRSSC